jgi:hypothetical protein
MVLPCKGEEITFLYKVVVVYAVFWPTCVPALCSDMLCA